MRPFTFDDVRAACDAIRPFVPVTPLVQSYCLGDAEQTFFFKLESLQRVKSFKIRGALNKMLSLTPEVLQLLKEGQITAGHARAILSLKSEKKQIEAAKKIIALALSVRQAETLCKNMNKEKEEKPSVTFEVNYVAECEKSLSKHLGRGVKIINGKRKGRFELEFYGEEDLQVLLEALMKIK